MVPPGRFSNADSDSVTPTNNLWIGNLSSTATDFCLMEVFAQYGALDAASYSSRSFGFVYFKRAEEAKVAKDALQGTVVKGLPIKIQFARPTKPSNHLWVGGISSSISREELEEEFMKFGKVEEFKFLRERNIAIVQFSKVEDASQAMKKMNGKRIGSDQIRVDFLRSHSSGKEQPLPGFRGSNDAQFQSGTMSHFDTLGSRRQQNHPQLAGGHKGDGQPNNVLWVGYPPTIEIDEQMLHNAFILFGEIERVTSFPQRHCSFVEFRSIDEARRAKEGLQGRLFNDPRITVMYSSDIAPGGAYNHSRPPPPVGIARANIPDGSPNNLASSNWRRLSPPAPGMIPSPSPGRRPGGWDVFDASQVQRDRKRSRIDPSLSINDAYLPSYTLDERRLGLDRSHGLGPLSDGSGADPYAIVQGKTRLSPVGGRADCIWRGVIAKGGTSVCLARCVPVGKGIGSELPETVNCSARTGLDMLAKHYTEAIGFEICYFLPDSEADFASYTEFLCYLGGKDRAGVAKLDDGTTLFLVPPSDFLTKVLKVVGPERLYGVILKSPQLSGSAPVEQHAHQSIPSSHSIDRHLISPQVEYGLIQKEQALQMDYNRFLHEDSKPSPRPPPQPTSGSVSAQSISQGYAPNSTAMSQAGIGLTPELIATLSSMLPANTQNSALGTAQQGAGLSTHRPPFHSAVHDDGGPSQVWNQQQLNHTGHLSQQPENQYNTHAPYPFQYEPFAMVPPGSTHAQDSVNLPNHGAVSMQPLPNFATPSPIGQYTVPPQVNQPYQHEFSHNTQEGYSVVHGTDPTVYGSSGFQTNNPMSSFNQVHGSNLGQPQAVMASAGNVNVEIPSQGQQFQSAVSGAVQVTAEAEVDKNQRYQSTLQFAANLLLQIQQQQQQQQQTGSPAGRGPGDRQ